jgi:hypothetical protein
MGLARWSTGRDRPGLKVHGKLLLPGWRTPAGTTI